MPKRKCSEIDKNVGLRLKKYRDVCGLTQDEVASVLNINRTTYTKYETGVSEPSHDLLSRIVSLFGTDFNSVLGGEEPVAVHDSGIVLNSLSADEKTLLMNFRAFSNEEKTELLAKIDEIKEERNRRLREGME